MGVAATIVLAFILLGAAMNEVGASTFFTDLAMAVMGRRRGGPAKVAVVASSLFGTISGSTIANIMTTGVITIPLMKRSGFPAHTAAGIEAVASNGGQLAPPVMGATAFLIAEFLQVPYREVVFAAALPALIYYIVLFLQIDAIAARLKIETVDASKLPRFSVVIRSGWLFILPLAYLIYLLFWTGASPGTAALRATAAMIIAGSLATRKIPGPRMFWNILHSAGTTLIPIMLICAAAGIVIGALNITGLGFLLTNALSHVGESMGIFVMLVLTALIAIFLGMGMPTAAVYIVLSIILAPALVRMGIAPMAAHLFIFYFGLLSMITPPVAIASYAAGAIAKASPWATGMAGMRLGIAAYFLPFLFCWDPALVGHGTAWQTVTVVFNCIAAGYLLAIAMSLFEGFRGTEDGVKVLGLSAMALILIVGGQLLGPAHPAMILLAFVVLFSAKGMRFWRSSRTRVTT
jgi:TRAP transporter 4TM/12TM fusion protein